MARAGHVVRGVYRYIYIYIERVPYNVSAKFSIALDDNNNNINNLTLRTITYCGMGVY